MSPGQGKMHLTCAKHVTLHVTCSMHLRCAWGLIVFVPLAVWWSEFAEQVDLELELWVYYGGAEKVFRVWTAPAGKVPKPALFLGLW